MKKYVHTIVCLAFSLQAFSQPNLTTTSGLGYAMPIKVATAATAANVPIATTGNGVTWDCSSLLQDTGTPTISFSVITPSGTPYASDYPGSNWCFTDPALAAAVGYSYHQLSADSFMFWGAHKASSAYEIYDNPEVILVFPFAFNQSVSNSYSKTNYTSAGGVSSYQTGDITISYEGFGTLILPDATYPSVAKVKSVRTNSLGPTTTSYMWYNTSTGERLLTYDGVSGNQVIYRSGAALGLSQHEINDNIRCYSQSSNLHIQSDSKIEQVQVISLAGQIVYNNSNPMQQTMRIRLQDVATGIYVVIVKTAHNTERFKLLIQE